MVGVDVPARDPHFTPASKKISWIICNADEC
jgi:hypothetical protein